MKKYPTPTEYVQIRYAHLKAPDLVIKAYRVQATQRARCRNKKNERYKSYGGNGVKVLYSTDAFVEWYVKNYPRAPGKWTVGRIDHSDDYCFDNIRFELVGDNVKERNARLGNPGRTHRAVEAFNAVTGKPLKKFTTKQDAAAHYGVSQKTVYNHCEGVTKSAFKYGPKNVTAEGVRFRWST